MSITADGRHIVCDGETCHASVALPIGLRAVLDSHPRSAVAGVADWLFVKQKSGLQHFCPGCAHEFLGRLHASAPQGPGETADSLDRRYERRPGTGADRESH